MKKIVLLAAVGLFPFAYGYAQPFPSAMAFAESAQVVKVAQKDKDAFLAAVKANHFNEVKQMLGKSKASLLLANVKDDQGNTPLTIAAEKGYFEIVKLLVDKGAYVQSANAQNQTALCLAAKNKRVKTVKYLTSLKSVRVDYECGPQGKQKTALLIAGDHGAVPEIIQALVDAKANVNYKTDSGETALMNVAGVGRVDSAEILLNAKADVNAMTTDRSRRTALFAAITNDKLDMAKFLVGKGAKAYTVYMSGDAEDYITPIDAARSEEMKTFLKSKGY